MENAWYAPEDFDPQERGTKLPTQVREWQV